MDSGLDALDAVKDGMDAYALGALAADRSATVADLRAFADRLEAPHRGPSAQRGEASLGTPEGRERAARHVARVVEPKGGAPQIVEAGAMSRYGRTAGE